MCEECAYLEREVQARPISFSPLPAAPRPPLPFLHLLAPTFPSCPHPPAPPHLHEHVDLAVLVLRPALDGVGAGLTHEVVQLLQLLLWKVGGRWEEGERMGAGRVGGGGTVEGVSLHPPFLAPTSASCPHPPSASRPLHPHLPDHHALTSLTIMLSPPGPSCSHLPDHHALKLGALRDHGQHVSLAHVRLEQGVEGDHAEVSVRGGGGGRGG